jgi:hypothetical protein
LIGGLRMMARISRTKFHCGSLQEAHTCRSTVVPAYSKADIDTAASRT